jgi:hypothetical protein
VPRIRLRRVAAQPRSKTARLPLCWRLRAVHRTFSHLPVTLGPDAQDLGILDTPAAVIDAYTQGPGANTDPWALTPDDADDADDLCGVFLA